MVAEAASVGIELVVVFASDDSPAVPEIPESVERVSVGQSVLERLSDTQSPQGPVAIAAIPPDRPPAGRHVILWGLSDPGNVGTIVRSAAAFGFDVVVGPDTADVWSPKVLRSAAGSHFRTGVSRHADLTIESIRAWPHPVHTSVVAGGAPPAAIDWPADAAILIGNEAHGLPDELAAIGVSVTIPMPGEIESLNAGVAAAVLMWEAGKSR